MKTLRLTRYSLVTVLLAITGCIAHPNRDHPGDFKLVDQVSVAPSSAQAFGSCVHDGFDIAHTFWDLRIRQERREGLTRIESLSGGVYVMISVDVHDDGRAEFYRYTGTVPSLRAEQKVFSECVQKFRVN